MTKIDISSMRIDQLLDRFVGLAFKQHDALEISNARQYNALYDKMTLVED